MTLQPLLTSGRIFLAPGQFFSRCWLPHEEDAMSLAAELDIPETGAVFTFGKSHFADNEPSHFFIKNDPVVDVACGDDHTAVICEQGRVFAFGSNNHGQLGLGHTDNIQRPACVKWLKPRKARQVACGRSHTVILTDKHQMFACGDNSEGQLGIGSLESQSVPQFVEIEGKEGAQIKQIATGAEHTVVLLESGNVYSCGSNNEGQLGLGEGVKNSPSLAEIPLGKVAKYIACGYYHTVIITGDGEAYIFGDNENHRLGIADTVNHIHIPRLMPVTAKLKTAHCGHYHTFFMSEDDKIFAVGSNEQGQLGLPRSVIEVNNLTDVSIEKLFDGHAVKKIGCGATHTAFVTENGYLYTCGDSSHQKLCLDEDSDYSNNNLTTDAPMHQYLPKRVDILEGFIINNVACGGCHTILTATKDANLNNNAEIQTLILSELPPLQKVPASILNRAAPDEEKLPELSSDSKITQDIDQADNINRNVPNNAEEEKHSIDSLEPNVTGSHIIEINELVTVSSATNMEDIENMNEEILIVEREIEINDTTKSPDIPDMLTELTPAQEEIQIEEIPNVVENVTQEIKNPEISKLQVPDVGEHSPNMSTKSEISQKTIKSSNGSQDSENETIICNSEKSSPQAAKVGQKMQAVIPILRNDDTTVIENKINDECDIVHAKLNKTIENEGKISKFFSGLKNESCIGKSRVISNVDIKEQIAKEEVINPPIIADQNNSRACTLL